MRLRTKLIVPVVGAIGLLLASFLVVYLRAQGQARDTMAADEARQVRDAFREHIDGNARTMESVLRVLASTEFAMKGDRERCLAGGMDDHLPKPVRRDDLAAVLARLAGEHLTPSPVAAGTSG